MLVRLDWEPFCAKRLIGPFNQSRLNNLVANSLCRMFEESNACGNECPQKVQPVLVVLTQILELFTPIGGAQRKDSELSDLILSCEESNPDHLKLLNGSILLNPPAAQVGRIIFAYYHESLVGGHLGANKTIADYVNLLKHNLMKPIHNVRENSLEEQYKLVIVNKILCSVPSWGNGKCWNFLER
uniref:Uncharacterized protein n=1 Tax=Timema monikensis TaxID=170555 RepID=A0A7R9DYK5_9NEOP|nr:unnamed protein product [Timema monikensis]